MRENENEKLNEKEKEIKKTKLVWLLSLMSIGLLKYGRY